MSRKYLIGTGVIVVAFAIFTGVAFVQSSEDVKAVNSEECAQTDMTSTLAATKRMHRIPVPFRRSRARDDGRAGRLLSCVVSIDAWAYGA